MRRAPFALVLGFLPACSSTAALSIDVTTGLETTAFTDAPAVVRVDVSVSSPVDSTLKINATTKPGGTFDLGNVPSSSYFTVALSGFSDAGGMTQVMTGSSLSGILASGVAGDMPVFIQRSGHWARPPGGLVCSHVGGVATVQQDRGLFLTGGKNPSGNTSCDPASVDGYDMFGLGGLATASALDPTTPTIVSILPDSNNPNSDSQGLLITAAGASWLDYTTGNTTAAALPTVTGGSFAWADVAGGAVIAADAGRWFVVGGTRTSGAPTAAVLEVDPSGNLGAYLLHTARLGAAAAWISGSPDRLVVAGGGGGLEVLASTVGASGSSFTVPPYPTLSVVGAAAVSTPGGSVLLVGGVEGTDPAPTRTFDPGCTSSCIPGSPAVTLPVTLQDAIAYQLSSGALVIGTEVGGMGATRTFLLGLLDPPNYTVTEAFLREQRRGATPIVSPNGAIALLGGEHLVDGSPALSIELFTP